MILSQNVSYNNKRCFGWEPLHPFGYSYHTHYTGTKKIRPIVDDTIHREISLYASGDYQIIAKNRNIDTY